MNITFIIGPARSGTTFLASLLKADDILYIDEPNPVWKYSNVKKKHDELEESDITPNIAKYIRNFFYKKLQKSTSNFLLEKTPTNCLRLSFINKIFPESKFIFLNRNPSDIAISSLKKWKFEQDANTKKIFQKNKEISHKNRYLLIKIEKFFLIPLRDIIYYLPSIFNDILFILFDKKRLIWGPRYKGMIDDLQILSKEDICLKQAKICLSKIYEFKNQINPSRFIEINYYDLSENNTILRNRILKFIRDTN